MKKVLNCLFLAVLLSSAVFAQAKGWKFESVFPADSSMYNGVHGIATDPDGKVWVIQYYALPKDSIQVMVPNKDTTASVKAYRSVRAIHVFTPDGKEVSFSPIYFNKVNGVVKDTLGGQSIFITKKGTTSPKIQTWDVNSGRGIIRDYDGNIIAAYWDWIYKFNYKTGEGMMTRITTGLTAFSGTGQPAVDSMGNIYCRGIAGGGPLKMFDKDGKPGPNVTDKADGYGRLCEVSKDGNTVLNPGYSVGVIQRFSRPDEYGTWAEDTLVKGVACESMTWNKKGQLWFSAGSYNDLPTDPKWTPDTWYLYDFDKKEVVDSLKWVFFKGDETNRKAERPRAIAVSPDEQTIYVGTFSYGAVRKYVYGTVGVEKENAVVKNYNLSQNYPNPFNPTTSISYQLGKDGFVTLKVYNLLGQEVSTLVSSFEKAGQHKVNFNAASLPSGTYIYRMNADGVSMTNKMMLLK